MSSPIQSNTPAFDTYTVYVRLGLCYCQDSAAAAASSTAREAKERLRGQQGELRSGLGALPAPKNEYVAIMPEAEAWDEVGHPPQPAKLVARRQVSWRTSCLTLWRVVPSLRSWVELSATALMNNQTSPHCRNPPPLGMVQQVQVCTCYQRGFLSSPIARRGWPRVCTPVMHHHHPVPSPVMSLTHTLTPLPPQEDGAAPMDEEDMADVEKQQVGRLFDTL